MTRFRTRRAGPALAALAVVALALAGCSGPGSKSGIRTINPSAQTVTTIPSTTVAGQVPTVFDCGGGAYKPATLLVQCGVATTTVTGVKWTSWTDTEADGSGTVNLASGGHDASAPADIKLTDVVTTPNGPQFSELQVTWTGASPDGNPVDRFKLAVATA